MKKILAICLCLVITLSMSCCTKNKTNNKGNEGSTGNTSNTDNTSNSDNTGTDSSTSSAGNNNASSPTSDTQSTPVSSTGSYTDITCAKISNFQQVSFCAKGSGVTIFINIPKDWKISKNGNSYSILKNSKSIGSVNATALGNPDPSLNVFKQEIAIKGMKVETRIDRVAPGKQSYIRTLSYNYTETGKNKSIVVTFNYEEADSSASYKMMSEAIKLASPQNNMGVLQINDNRKRILILGNSFVSTSNVGNILQTMCGSSIKVEAESRGMATLGTYTADNYTLQNIRSGKYSVLCMCGLFNELDFFQLKKIIDACEASNTKLAVFPAHNENRTQIDRTASVYPETIVLDWKAEIDGLIHNGIDKSYFCINDAHMHSTPLAGYVGAHMIYRAVFNKIPQTTNIPGVTKSELNLLGDYVKTGAISLLDESSTYIIG